MAVKRSNTRRQTTRRRSTVAQRGRRRHAPQKSPPAVTVTEVESLRAELDRFSHAPSRWNADPDEVRKSVLKLVLTLVEFIRQILERQAIRRMEANTLTSDETEAVGLALMRLEDTVRELAEQFGIHPDELNLDLGPIGKLV